MRKTIWIDISELHAWRGKLTGVPRVINELAARFVTDKNYAFVAWDGAQGAYMRVNLPSGPKVSRLTAVVSKVAKHAGLNANTQVIPQEGDTLMIMADWHGSDKSFVEYVINLKQTGVRLAQMAYDLLPIVTPQYSGHATESLTHYAQWIYPICDVIIAISEHTKKDITGWLQDNKLAIPEIKVIRLGDDFKIAKPKKPAAAVSGKNFILCVGTLEARKNHTLLYYAYRLALSRGIDFPKLVIVGRRGWKTDDLYELLTNDPVITQQFILLESASDEELSWLYQNCLFSIYPSFYEGWGLPIAESIAHGAPCICSDSSSMPEVAGDLVSYFNPFSSDECMVAIETMLKPGNIEAANERLKAYKPTSWDQTFAEVKSIMEATHGKNA